MARSTTPISGGLLLLTLLASSVSSAQAGDYLRLTVTDCNGQVIDGALIEVTLYRLGVGDIDSDSGYTDGSGRAAFYFDDLEAGDEAHVVVTPAGQEPDGDHVYTYKGGGQDDLTAWDLGQQVPNSCSDFWGKQYRYIHCIYYAGI